MLDLSIGTDPLLSGPSVQAEYLSSCFEVVAQPMTMELGTSVSRGLKRGLESGDMAIAAANEVSHSLIPELEDEATGPQIYKMMLVLTAHHGWCVSFSDVSRIFLHTSIKDPLFDVTPEEYQSQISGRGVGSMLQLDKENRSFSVFRWKATSMTRFECTTDELNKVM